MQLSIHYIYMVAENKLGLVQITFADYAFALLVPLRTIRYIYI